MKLKSVSVDADVRKYMADIVDATRQEEDVLLGVSPRGLLSLLVMAQAWAALDGRDYVIPDDVRDIVVPTLAHRIISKSGYSGAAESNEKIVRKIIEGIKVPTEKISE